MVHRPTSYTIGESPSFLQVIGIIIAVTVGLVISVVVILLLMACCVLLCCPKKAERNSAGNHASRENRSRPYFCNLNPTPRRDDTETVLHTTPQPSPMSCHGVSKPMLSPFTASAPPLASEHSARDVERSLQTTLQISPNTDNPPSYADATVALNKLKI